MRPNAGFAPRNLARQGVLRILPALVLTFAALLFSARPVAAEDSSGDQTLLNHWRTILGPVEVRLVFTDADGKQQDISLAEAPPDLLAKLTPRLQAESKLPLLDPKVRYFDAQWLLNRDAICKEVSAFIQKTFPAGATNEAYDVSCRPFKYGFMNAYIAPKVHDYFTQFRQGVEVIPAGGYPTGTVRQLQVGLSVPVNGVSFTLTSSCTCHSANATCNKDPDFTLIFDVTFNVMANSTELNAMKFDPTPQMQIGYLVDSEALGWENGQAFAAKSAALEAQVEQQLEVALTTLAFSDGSSIFAAIGELVVDLFKYGPGSLLEATCDSNLYGTVSASLAGLGNNTATDAPTIIKMANQADDAFKTLYEALQSGSDVGFAQLDVVQGAYPDLGLQFRLTDAPAKPALQNAIAARNNGIHLVRASIGTGGEQIKPGVPFPVSGSNFALPSANELDISWNRTINTMGAGTTTLQWGPKDGTMQTVPLVLSAIGYAANSTATGLGFSTPATLKPSAPYQFRVQECDTIACSPWSDWLETSTQSGGSSNVKLWLDNDAADSIGTGMVGPDGGFSIGATIPAGTAAGSHTINAGIGNDSEASVQVTVAGAGGSGSSASISVMNTSTHTAFTPPINMTDPNPFTLRGYGFAPSATVTVYLDSAAGTKLGTAVPGKDGAFQGNFNMPNTSTGAHKLVAVQGAVEASLDVNLSTSNIQ